MPTYRRARAEAERHRRATWESPVTFRLAGCEDTGPLERLAGLDTRPLPAAPHLLAIREGRIDAAISLSTGEVVADPFRRTAELCELLRCHAGQLRLTADARPTPVAHPRPMLAPT